MKAAVKEFLEKYGGSVRAERRFEEVVVAVPVERKMEVFEDAKRSKLMLVESSFTLCSGQLVLRFQRETDGA